MHGLELVYIWVNKYKHSLNDTNINLTGKFIINFNKDSDNLTINYNKDYDRGITAYNKDNISISLIVGSNGSGKSTILDLIRNGSSIRKDINTKIEKIYPYFFGIYYDRKNGKLILDGISKKDGSLEIEVKSITSDFTVELNKLEIKNDYAIIGKNYCGFNDNLNVKNIFFSASDNSIYPMLKNTSQLSENLEDISDAYQYSKIIEQIEKTFKTTVHSFKQIQNYFDDTQIVNSIQALYSDGLELFDGFKMPNTISIEIHDTNVKNRFNAIIEKLEKEKNNRQHNLDMFKALNKLLDFKYDPMNNKVAHVKYLTILNLFNIHYNENALILIPQLDEALLKIDFSLSIEAIFQSFRKSLIDLESSDKRTEHHIFSKYFKMVDSLVDALNKYEKYQSKYVLVYDVPIEENTESLPFIVFYHQELTVTASPFLTYELNPPMSSGEKYLFYFFGKIYGALNSAFSNKKINRGDTVLLLLDEPDNFLHPEWQRSFISLLSDYLASNYIDYFFNIIIATHSPLMLSDVPKNNVVFLNEGSSRTYDGETMLDNIHTILANGFFLESTVGEYALKVLNDLLELSKEIANKNSIDSDDLTIHKYQRYKEKFIFLLDHTGEVYIKNMIQSHMDSIETIIEGITND